MKNLKNCEIQCNADAVDLTDIVLRDTLLLSFSILHWHFKVFNECNKIKFKNKINGHSTRGED